MRIYTPGAPGLARIESQIGSGGQAMTSCPLRRLPVFLVMLLTSSGCGGGGDGGGSNENAAMNSGSPPTISSITVTCDPYAVAKLETTTCSALVTGSGNFDSSVTWWADSGALDSSTRRQKSSASIRWTLSAPDSSSGRFPGTRDSWRTRPRTTRT